MLTQNIMIVESEFLWCETSEQGLLSFALLASVRTQNAEDVTAFTGSSEQQPLRIVGCPPVGGLCGKCHWLSPHRTYTP